MSLIPPQQRPLLSGTNLTDKGCQSLQNPLSQNNGPHNFDLVPPGFFTGCVPTDPHQEKIGVNVRDAWVSLNFISTASIQEMIGKVGIEVVSRNLLTYVVSVDEHPMWVYEIDGRYIEPVLVDVSQYHTSMCFPYLQKLGHESLTWKPTFSTDPTQQAKARLHTACSRRWSESEDFRIGYVLL